MTIQKPLMIMELFSLSGGFGMLQVLLCFHAMMLVFVVVVAVVLTKVLIAVLTVVLIVLWIVAVREIVFHVSLVTVLEMTAVNA